MTAEHDSMPPTVGIVTPTYLPDLSRCELLVESVQRCCPEIPHRLIVPRRDRSHFRHLEPYAELITDEELLPNWLRRLPVRRPIWLSARTRPTRGWIVQQILKIAAAEQSDEDVSVFCDSDVAFVRRFSVDQILSGTDVGLLDVDFVNDEVVQWTETAADLLGVTKLSQPMRGHVGCLIAWRRDNVRRMTELIERQHGAPWQASVIRANKFSEYILYGTFVREVLGYEHSGHFPSAVPFVRLGYGIDPEDDAAVEAFVRCLEPENVAIMVHSKDGIEPSRYRHLLEERWEAGD